MNQTRLSLKRPQADYAPMPLSRRAPHVNRMGFCSTLPAKEYQDALYAANGTIKALIYGDPYAERIDFFHERFYIPRWKQPPKPPAIAHILPDVRRMLMEGKFKEVPQFAIEEITKDPVYDELMRWSPDGKTRWSIHNNRQHGAFTMHIDATPQKNAADYLRTSDLATGETRILWTDANGAQMRRMFVSRPDAVACQLLAAPQGGTVDARIRLSQLGGASWDSKGAVSQEAFVDGDGYIVVKGSYDPQVTQAGFACAVRVVVVGGTVTAEADALVVKGAQKALLLTALEPLPFFGEDGVSALKARVAGVQADYDALLRAHEAQLRPLMERSGVCLCSDEDALKSVEELLEEQLTETVVSAPMLEKLYHLGRYFLINDTGELPPSWGQYNINVNLQVCSGNITGLPEAMRVFFDFFESKYEDFRLNAKNIFGCRGIMASIHPDYESGYQFHFSGPWPHYYWVACAGWVLNEFWGYYLTTGDEAFLRDHIVPGLKEVALFFEDFLKDTDENGSYIFYPCFSPENGQARGYPITINALMDIMVCREVLDNLLTTCDTLGLNDPKADKWREMLSKLPVLLADEQGALREWAWADIPDDLDHRHVSHHYDVWPGYAITWEEAPELAEATLKSNRKRGQENDSAHGLMHRLFTAIRLKDTVHASGILKQLFEHGFVNKSLMTNHNPHRWYCPDALGGLPAVMAEMAAYSKPGVIELLPAMPKLFAKGEIKGVCLYTFAKLDTMSWDLDAGQLSASIVSLRDQAVTLRIRQGFRQLTVDGKRMPAQKNELTLTLKKDVPMKIEADLIPRAGL